jgi:SAM-dependent methyltransferase
VSQTWSSPEPVRLHANRLRAESFGDVALEYDRVRPSYPDALIDELAAPHPADALDIGTGTGKAARLLADRGVAVLGVELDAKMAEVARGHGIPVEVSSFERWDDAGRQFDLAVSGQAWHWIDPVVGVPKAARVLRPGGTLALFWNVARLGDDIQAALSEVYRKHAADLLRPVADREHRAEPPYAADLRASEMFSTVEHREYPWQRAYTRDEWLALIQTQSDHVLLVPDRRAALVAAVAAAIDRGGGVVDARYVTHTVLARRSS